MKVKKITKQKVLSIIFILILLGSVLAYAIIGFFGNKNQSFLPENRIINYKLNQNQVMLLVSYYFTVVEYNYTSDCLECLEVKNRLEELTQNSEGQMYLQEILVETKPTLYIVNAFNETLIEEPTVSQAVNAVCDSLFSTPVWCTINRI
ncbi:MAG: hypothetical protein N3E38_02330 [Candidatus Aenigmarchaeota archaeon]|nr:hypothetical protein [Candidatus Aenigmarchaeota archaeon]